VRNDHPAVIKEVLQDLPVDGGAALHPLSLNRPLQETLGWTKEAAIYLPRGAGALQLLLGDDAALTLRDRPVHNPLAARVPRRATKEMTRGVERRGKLQLRAHALHVLEHLLIVFRSRDVSA
jgi:hypothetical protein